MSGKSVEQGPANEFMDVGLDQGALASILAGQDNQGPDKKYNALQGLKYNAKTGQYRSGAGQILETATVNELLGSFERYKTNYKSSKEKQSEYLKLKSERPGRDATILFDAAKNNMMGI